KAHRRALRQRASRCAPRGPVLRPPTLPPRRELSQDFPLQLRRVRRSRPDPLKGYALDYHGFRRHVRTLRRDTRNLLHKLHVVALSEDGVSHVQVRRRDFRNEKLAAVRPWPSIRHGQPPGYVELECRHALVFERESRSARTSRAIAQRVPTLNHEFRNHA